MKLFATIIACLIGTTASADVDYIAIGEVLNRAKDNIENARTGVACLIRDYAVKPTCQKIENMNREFSSLQSETSYSSFTASCASGLYFSNSIGGLRDYVANMRSLAKRAKDTDAIWAVIEKYERSIDVLVAEVQEAITEARLQETYVTRCLFQTEPEPTPILDRICKQN